MGFPLTASLAPNSLTFTSADGRTHLVPSTHPRFALLDAVVRVAQVLQQGVDERPYQMALQLLPQLATGSAMPKTVSLGNLQLSGNSVVDSGESVDNQAAQRAVWAAQNDIDPGPTLAFLNRLLSNPSKRPVDDLFDYVDRHGLALTKDGYIVGYVQVGPEHAGPGTLVEVRRNRVEEDLSRPSPHSLNFGPFPHFAMEMRRANLRVLAVLVDPADVVAVPTLGLDDIRCCRYQVISDCGAPGTAVLADEDAGATATDNSPSPELNGTSPAVEAHVADLVMPGMEPVVGTPNEPDGVLHFTALSEPPPEAQKSASLFSRMAGSRLS